MPYHDDGSLIDSNLGVGFSSNAYSAQVSSTTIQLGQIASVYYIDDTRNVSKRYVEYDVFVSENRTNVVTYRNVRSVDSFGDNNNFNETVLHDMRKRDQLRPDVFETGAWVMVGCLYGHKNEPYILRAVQHPSFHVKEHVSKAPEASGSSPERDSSLKKLPTVLPGAKREDGQRMLGEFVGVRWNINKDGELTIMVQGPKDDTGALIDSKGPTILKFNKDGEFFVLDEKEQELLISPSKGKIKLTDNNGELIEIDSVAKKISVASRGDISENAGGNLDQTVGGNWSVTVTGNVELQALGNIDMKAPQIVMNGVTMGSVLTTVTDPIIDTIFGAATTGVPTVKAG
jgi:hypothetical protein